MTSPTLLTSINDRGAIARQISVSLIFFVTLFVQVNTQLNPNETIAMQAFRSAWIHNNFIASNWTSSSVCAWGGVRCRSTSIDQVYLLGTRLTGTIPTQIGLLTAVRFFDLTGNQLNGTLPSQIGLMQALQAISLADNQISGTIPTEIGLLSSLTELSLSGNQISGSIPTQIIGRIGRIQLSGNRLSGSIPTEWGTDSYVIRFDISENQIEGTIPTQMFVHNRMSTLNVSHNRMSGTIPTEIGLLNYLRDFDASSNLFNGTLPTQFNQSLTLSTLRVRNNRLNGTFPLSDVAQWDSAATNLRIFDLGMNDFTLGSIPAEFVSSISWELLGFAASGIIGTIPTEIALNPLLQSLDLSYNQLVGTVPLEIVQLTNLRNLQLGYNQLSGSIPTLFEVTFLTRQLTNCSFANNFNLTCPAVVIQPPYLCQCDPIPPTTTSPPPSSTTTSPPPSSSATAPTPTSETGLGVNNADTSGNESSNVTWIIAVAAVATVICVVFLVLLVACFVRRRKNSATAATQDVATTKDESAQVTDINYVQYKNVPQSDAWQVVDLKRVSDYVNIANALDSVTPESAPKKPQTSPFDIKRLLMIDALQLQFGRLLGEGSFGQVWLGKWRQSPAAIKQVKRDVVNDKAIDDFFREAALVSSIHPHANIVQLFGVCLAPLCVVLECLPRGSLRSYLDNESNQVDIDQVMRWARDIASGMLHLSLEGIVHRDLAARNVLLADDLQAKITDFGMSRKLDHDNAYYTLTAVGPLKWMSPEAIKHNQFTEKSDVWSYGVTMIEVLTRRAPYPTINAAQVAAQVSNNQLRAEVPSTCSDQKLREVLNGCFEFDVQERFTFKRIADLLEA